MANLTLETYSAAATYDELGAKYEAAFDNVPAQIRSLTWLLTRLGNDSPKTVLDLGSGTGRPAAAMLAAAGHRVTGVDVSPRMVEIARAQVPGATFEVADARSWAPPVEAQGSFDAVTAYFSFIAGVTPGDIRAMFKRAHAWLREGGFFVFGTVPVEGEGIAIKWLGKDVVVSSLSAEETVQAIKEAGFEVDKAETEAYVPRAVEAGICEQGDVWEEQQLFVYARKK